MGRLDASLNPARFGGFADSLEGGFQADGPPVRLAGDLVIIIEQADGFGLRSLF